MTGIARFYLTKLLKEYPHPIALVEAIDENVLVEGKKHYGALIVYSRYFNSNITMLDDLRLHLKHVFQNFTLDHRS